MIKNLTSIWESWIQSLGWEDPLEKGTTSHSSVLAGKSHGKRSLAGYSPRVAESDTTEIRGISSGKVRQTLRKANQISWSQSLH